MANEYEKLVAQGVPPNVAAQTIYDNLKRTNAKTKKTPQRPQVTMAKEPEGEQPKVQGRPIDPLSGSRMLASVLLAQSYTTNSRKTITLEQVKELMTEAYARANARPRFPKISSMQGLMSKLRQGQVAGFPVMSVEGPLERTWDGKRQFIFHVGHRSKELDLRENQLNLELIPAWVLD